MGEVSIREYSFTQTNGLTIGAKNNKLVGGGGHQHTQEFLCGLWNNPKDTKVNGKTNIHE